MTYADTTITDFVSRIAEGQPTPGGGSAAAIVGATGAALVEMLCNLTIGREEHADVEAGLIEIRDDLESRRERLFDLADEDASAFEDVMAAYRSDDDDRAAKIESASKQATEVPLETAEACLAVVEHAERVTEVGNENAVTDGGTGALLANAALQAALYNVAVNLGTIDDEAFVADTADRAEDVEARAEEALSAVTETVDAQV